MTENTRPVEDVLAVLAGLGERLDALLCDAGGEDAIPWSAPTPAAGWTVAHQIAHLTWTDEASLLATRGDAAFEPLLAEGRRDPFGFVDLECERVLAETGRGAGPLLERWRTSRARLGEALREVDPGTPLPWFGPPMRPKSMATARVMETWAHGIDIADGLRAAPGTTPTAIPDLTRDPAFEAALPHVARLGHRTRDFAYLLSDLEPPATEFRVELDSPVGPVAFGPEGAEQGVTGPALDFCLLVTQRVHRADTALVARGADADRWLDLAQCFAGRPGAGREKGHAR